MRIPTPPPPPSTPSTPLKRKCKPHTLLGEIAARIAQSPIITARKSYISRGSALAQQKSRSRRDLAQSSLLSVTCDSTIGHDKKAAALATFSQLSKKLEDLDDGSIGKEALLQSPSSKKVSHGAPISTDELEASKSKLKSTRRRSGSQFPDASPRTSTKSIIGGSPSRPPRRNSITGFLAHQIKSRSRRGDLVTCDDTILDENQQAATLATFKQLTNKILLEDLDAGSIGTEALLQSPSRTSRKISIIDASPPRTPRKSIKTPEASPATRGRKSPKALEESPRINGKRSSNSKKKKIAPQGDCTTPVIKNRKKVCSSPAMLEKRTPSKKDPGRKKSVGDINWLKADPIDVSNCSWAMLGLGPLVDSSISNHAMSTSSVDDTSSHKSGDEDSWCKLSVDNTLSSHNSGDEDSWYKLSMNTGLDKKTTIIAATKKEKNRVKSIPRQFE